MTKFLVFFLFLFCCNELVAQAYLLPYRNEQKWGFVDININEVIHPKYDSVSLDSYHNRWTIYSNGKTGQINEFGNVIIPTVYDEIKHDVQFSELHYNYLIKDDKIGYANMDGKIILPCEYDNLSLIDYPFQHDQYDLDQFNFFIKKDGIYSIIDHSGAVFLDGIDKIENESDGKYLFQIDKKWGLYFIGYKYWIIPCEYDSLSELPDNRSYRERKRTGRKYYYYAELGAEKYFFDRELNLVHATQHMIDSVFPPIEEIREIDMDSPPVVAVESINNAESYQSITELADSTTGKLDIRPNYRGKSIDNISFTQDKGKMGALINGGDTRGKILLPEYDDILLLRNQNGSLANQLLLLKKNGKFGLYDMRDYKIIVEPIYDSIAPSYRNDIFIIYKNDKLGLLEYNEKIIEIPFLFIPPEFDSFEGIEFIDEIGNSYKSKVLYVFEENGKKCLVNWQGNFLFEN